MLTPLLREWRRRWLLRRAPPGPVKDFLAAGFPPGGSDWREVGYLALDLETTGGDPLRDEIVSFGWVCIDRRRIVLASARHRLVRLAGAMSAQSAVIHRITDDEAAEGVPLEQALEELLQAMAGRIMIAHHAATEVGFVGEACRRRFGAGILTPAVDTLSLAFAARQRQRRPPRPGELRLGNLRRQYGLPRYPAHNALSDALAAAELFLALAEEHPQPASLEVLLAPR